MIFVFRDAHARGKIAKSSGFRKLHGMVGK